MRCADTTPEPVPVAGDAETAAAGCTADGRTEGNKNALKHGRYTAEAIARRRSIATLIRAARQLVDE
jgi:hypothetical protein